MEEHVRNFRDGIFSLRTRRFGTVAEIMIKKIHRFKDSKTLAHDLVDHSTSDRIEVKFSTVMKANDSVINETNVVDQIISASTEERALKDTEIGRYSFDCNIQQIKRVEFDVLYYGLFFAESVYIFSIRSEEIERAGIGYSDKQHRGNIGEGQFHINELNFNYHVENFLLKKITYEELYNLLV